MSFISTKSSYLASFNSSILWYFLIKVLAVLAPTNLIPRPKIYLSKEFFLDSLIAFFKFVSFKSPKPSIFLISLK